MCCVSYKNNSQKHRLNWTQPVTNKSSIKGLYILFCLSGWSYITSHVVLTHIRTRLFRDNLRSDSQKPDIRQTGLWFIWMEPDCWCSDSRKTIVDRLAPLWLKLNAASYLSTVYLASEHVSDVFDSLSHIIFSTWKLCTKISNKLIIFYLDWNWSSPSHCFKYSYCSNTIFKSHFPFTDLWFVG